MIKNLLKPFVFCNLFLGLSANAQTKCFDSFITESSAKHNREIVRCSSTEYEHFLSQGQADVMEKRAAFEAFIAPKIEEIKRNQATQRSSNQVIIIPVVFHVIHDGDAVGVNENISDLQIFSQIDALNQDYRKKINTPGYNTNPVGADMEIEFRLARRDVNGNLTTGINRYNKGRAAHTNSQIETIKRETIWNAANYLNIWTVNFTAGLLGYAQFPQINSIPGLNYSSPSDTDGVVLGYSATGSKLLFPQGVYSATYNGGRTATHEIGHYLGLIHIFADTEGCTNGTDYCADTPNHYEANYTCGDYTSCGAREMVENYMDYTNDGCMNIFTNDQKNRVRAVLASAPRRNTLGAVDNYTINGTEAGIYFRAVMNQQCNSVTLGFVVKNNGTSTINSGVVRTVVNGQSVDVNLTSPLAPGETADVLATVPVLNTATSVSFTGSLVNINGSATDVFSTDNTVTGTRTITTPKLVNSNSVALTLKYDSYPSETSWRLYKNNVVVEEGNGANAVALTTITRNFTIESNQCYRFEITDSEDDGICCSYGQGNVTLISGGTSLMTGGNFGSGKFVNFYTGVLSTTDINALSDINIYPNPTQGLLNIGIGNLELPKSYTIYNALGQVVKYKNIIKQSDLEINTTSLTDGVYSIQISNDNQNKTLRFVKN